MPVGRAQRWQWVVAVRPAGAAEAVRACLGFAVPQRVIWGLAPEGRRGREEAFILVAMLVLAAVVAPVSAAPKGQARDSDVGKKLFQFNVIAVPQADWTADDDVCPNNGSRMFFEYDGAGTLARINWSLDVGANPDFNITDCDGTYDGDGDIVANQSLRFWVMIKLVGPKTSTLSLTCTEIYDDPTFNDQVCLQRGHHAQLDDQDHAERRRRRE